MIELTVNGTKHSVDVEPEMPCCGVARRARREGPKYGCGIAQCGACTVHLNGEPCARARARVRAAGQKVLTIEGLAQRGQLHPVQKAWIDHEVPQCGYCQSGRSWRRRPARKESRPSDKDIDAAMTNICRCEPMRASARDHAAAKTLKSTKA